MSNFEFEILENFSQKQLVCLVLDSSSSMSDEAINEMQNGVIQFFESIISDSVLMDRLEVAIIEFNDSAHVLREPGLVVDNKIPKLTKKGSSTISCGLYEAVQTVEMRKNWYKQTGMPYYRPWIILITDARTEENVDILNLSRVVRLDETKLRFIAIGVNGADMELLNSISSPKNPAIQMQCLKLTDFFTFLENSITAIIQSPEQEKGEAKVDLSELKNWSKCFDVS